MSTKGTVEELQKSPERWAFLLRLESGEGVNVELRGDAHGTLRDGDVVELQQTRVLRSHDVVVATRVRNETLRSSVTATPPGWSKRTATFLVPPNIWAPLGGFGGAAFTLLVTSARGNPSTPPPTPTPTPDASHTPSPSATATSSPLPTASDQGANSAIVPWVVIGLTLLIATVAFATRARVTHGEPSAPPARPAESTVARFVLYVALGGLAGLVLRLLLG